MMIPVSLSTSLSDRIMIFVRCRECDPVHAVHRNPLYAHRLGLLFAGADHGAVSESVSLGQGFS